MHSPTIAWMAATPRHDARARAAAGPTSRIASAVAVLVALLASALAALVAAG